MPVFQQIKTNNRDIPSLELKHSARMINIRFTALQFNNPGGQKFRYRLEGFDDSWIYPTNDQLASFSNLPPGEYIFQLEVQKNNGEWNSEGSTLAIKIKPPFWITLPFIGITILVLILAMFLILRVRSQTLLHRQLELEKIIDKRTEELRRKNVELELVNQTKNKFFSIISHDLRSPFSGLLGILELLNQPGEVPIEMHNNLLKSAYQSANNTFQLLENLLTWASTQMDKVSFDPTTFNLTLLIHINSSYAKNKPCKRRFKFLKICPNISMCLATSK